MGSTVGCTHSKFCSIACALLCPEQAKKEDHRLGEVGRPRIAHHGIKYGGNRRVSSILHSVPRQANSVYWFRSVLRIFSIGTAASSHFSRQLRMREWLRVMLEQCSTYDRSTDFARRLSVNRFWPELVRCRFHSKPASVLFRELDCRTRNCYPSTSHSGILPCWQLINSE